MKTYQSISSKKTMELGEKLAKTLSRKRHRGALVLALKGDLGAGKTTFVQGFFKGLGLKKRAISPTFIIMRRHALRSGKFTNIFHLDAYRLKNAKAFKALGLQNIFMDSKNVVLIEWADRAKKIFPKDAYWLEFKHGKKENERSIMIKR
jgi:tRNA threonylcarbamoyladenosine biosynthesis protein TsaE